MVIDRESFTEICVRLKLASDGLLACAKAMQMLTHAGTEYDEHHWHQAISGLEHTLSQHMTMEQLLTALLHAQDIVPPSPTVGSA